MKKLVFSVIVLVLMIASVVTSEAKKEKPYVTINVMYFHGPTRCQECLLIEQFTHQTLTSNFYRELQSLKVTWKTADFTSDSTMGYEEHYKLETQTLVITRIENGKEVKWVKLDKVWDYLKDYPKFEKYVKTSIKKLMK